MWCIRRDNRRHLLCFFISPLRFDYRKVDAANNGEAINAKEEGFYSKKTAEGDEFAEFKTNPSPSTIVDRRGSSF